MLLHQSVSYYNEPLNIKLFQELITLDVPLNIENDEGKKRWIYPLSKEKRYPMKTKK
jgi:hypothetical protein